MGNVEVSRGEIILYKAPDGGPMIDVRLEQESIWLTQAQIAELFQRDRSVITKHMNNIFSEGELDKKSNVQKIHIPHSEKPIVFYNLDVILSVGYRVNSKRGTQFRIWATGVLRNHLLKGYTVNPKRLRELRQSIRLVESALMIAISAPEEKDVMCRMVVNLINARNG